MQRGLLLIAICIILMIGGAFLMYGQGVPTEDDAQTATPQTFAQVSTAAASAPTTSPTLTLTLTEISAVTPQPPAATLALITPATRSGQITHTVQRGETLYQIAQHYGISLEALAAANNLSDVNTIYIGQTLIIPTSSANSASPAAPIASAPTNNPNDQRTASAPNNILSTPQQPLPRPSTINGVPLESFIIINEAAQQHIREIFATGQALGRNPRAFSKVGDSTIEPPHFLARFDDLPGTYNLGDFVYLQEVIDVYRGSFAHSSAAVRRGMHSWTTFDPTWSSPALCLPGEGPVICEIRAHNPSIMFIRLGSNDVGVPEMFDRNIRRIVDYCLTNGIIPIIGTKADRHEGDNTNNNILRQIAADYHLPLWDFDVVAGTIAGRGLDSDNVHMTTFFAHDYTSPVAFTRGHGVHNLTALMMLDAVWRIISTP